MALTLQGNLIAKSENFHFSDMDLICTDWEKVFHLKLNQLWLIFPLKEKGHFNFFK